MQPEKKAVSAARSKLILSMFLFGTISLFVRFVPLPSGRLSLARGVIGVAFLLVLAAVTRQPLSFRAIRQRLVLLCLSDVWGGSGRRFVLRLARHPVRGRRGGVLCRGAAAQPAAWRALRIRKDHFSACGCFTGAAAVCADSGAGRQRSAQPVLRFDAVGAWNRSYRLHICALF